MTDFDRILDLVDRGALFVCNHSGGKDSQAMYIKLRQIVPAEQLIVVHAPLGRIEWPGTLEHILETIESKTFLLAEASKTFFDMVEHRKMFPSPQQRQCTSDLKRGPIEREIRRYLKQHPEHNGLVVNCMGLRAEESTNRAKQQTLKFNSRNSKAGREWYDWLPIHGMLVGQVFKTIADAGQKPHWAYEKGMTRLSCCFCIMASQEDLTTAAKLQPELYQEYVEIEQRLGFTLSMSRQTLPEITGI